MGLTKKQQQIIEATTGHYIILAGPGCGKTYTLIEKIFHLFKKDIIPEPYGLLAITYTDAAARTMRGRLRSKGFSQWDRIWVGTFHSFGRYILSCYGSDIGVKENFDIVEPEIQMRIIKDLIEKNNSGLLSVPDTTFYFEKLKRKGIYPNDGDEALELNVKKIFSSYNSVLRGRNLLDFGDLVAFTVKLFKKSDLVKRLYTSFFQYIIVDELQDTDEQQLEIIKVFARNAIGSTVAGDEDQSIFGWRGASRENIKKLKEILCSKVEILGQNFRSDEVIVEAAEKVIGIDLDRTDKSIISVSKERGYLYYYQFEDPEEEASNIAKWIIKILKDKEVENPGDVAVITRNRYRIKWLIEELSKKKIPWFDRSTLQHQESWETSLSLSIIQFAQNPKSSKYLFNTFSTIEESGISFRLGEQDAFNIALKIRDQLLLAKEKEDIQKDVFKLMNLIGIRGIIQKASTGRTDIKRRMENLEKMLNDVSIELEKHEINNVINRLLGYDAVQLISGHKSKGCEFNTVFFLGLEDDTIPDYRNHRDEKGLAEERRIFYVGLTRAKKVAYLTNVLHRIIMTRNGPWNKNTEMSRFIKQIPEDYFS